MANSSFDSGSDKLPARSVLHQPTDAENNWRPDLSKERPEWRDAHAIQKEAPLTVDNNGVYVVKDGDTVYDIARRSLKAQNGATDVNTINQEVGKIVEHNVDAYPGLANNPHLIHPGDQLRLGIGALNVPPLDQVATPGAPAAPADASATPAPVAAADTPPAVAPDAPPATPAPLAPPDAPLTPAPSADALPPLAPLTPVDTSSQGTGGGPPPVVPISPGGVAPGSDAQSYAADPAYAGAAAPPPGFAMPAPYQGNFGPSYAPQVGGDYTDQEAYRLSLMMANDPHAAANEMRNQIQGLDPGTAGVLVAKTKNDELVGGLGDLQIQVEYNQFGQDSGYRNVTMATPDGIEQIAELQSQRGYNGGNPLGYIAGAIVGDLLWQQNRGMNFNDGQYQGWCNREQGRENYWYSNNNQFVQNWQNPNYRSNYQSQNWQSVAINPTANNTYITNNRYDTTINNRTVNTTIINQTINNSKTEVNTSHPRSVAPVTPTQFHRVSGLPPVITPVHTERTAPGQRANTGAPAAIGEVQTPGAPNAAQRAEAAARLQHQQELAAAEKKQQADQAAAALKTRQGQEVPAATKTQHDQEVAAVAKVQHDQQLAAAAKAQHDQQLAAAAKAQHDQQLAAAAKAQHDQQLAAAAKAQHDQQLAAAAKAQHDQQLAAAAKAQHDQQLAAAAKAQHDEQIAAAAKAQHDQQVAAAARAQHDQELAAAARAQHDQELAAEARAKAAIPPPPKK
jgi:hypothetical protein